LTCGVNNDEVTLRQGLKPHGFFCHSFVRDTLRSGAWLRLGAHRNEGGIARKQRLHSGVLSPGRCHARSCFHALRKGKNGPQLALSASWEPGAPASFDATPLGTYPQGRRLFLSYFCVLLHFLKPYSRWCRAFVTAHSLVHLEQHGRVFTAGPSPANPYTLQFSRCSAEYSTNELTLQLLASILVAWKQKP